MAVPRDAAARRYYRAAGQRLDDARFILAVGRTTAPVDLAGYCVECLLKALSLSQTPAARRAALLPELMTHSFADLLQLYAAGGGGSLPPTVRADLNLVGTWVPRLRYDP